MKNFGLTTPTYLLCGFALLSGCATGGASSKQLRPFTPRAYDFGKALGVYEAPDAGDSQSVLGGPRFKPFKLARPAPGQMAIDPQFGTKIRALTNGFRHHYSQLQAYSSDGRYVLGFEFASGSNQVRDALTGKQVGTNFVGSGAKWIPGTHTVLTFAPDPVQVLVYLADTDQQGRHMVLDAQNFESGRFQEEMDKKGRWTAMVLTAPEERILTLDLREKKIVLNTTVEELCGGVDGILDFAGISPHGKYLVMQWVGSDPGRCQGMELYDIRTGKFVRQLTLHHHHSDFGMSAKGRAYMMTLEYIHPGNNDLPGMVRYWLDDGSREFLRLVPWGAFAHVSCQGPPGAACVITGAYEFAERRYAGEIWLLHQDGAVHHLAHHRSNACGDYWAQPHASMSPDGGSVVFASDWGQGCDKIGMFEIELFQRQ